MQRHLDRRGMMRLMLSAVMFAPRRRARANSFRMLGALGSCDPTASCSPPFDTSTEQWRSYVGPALAAANLPSQLVDFVLAWIRIESDGEVSSTGNAAGGEVGLFQLSQEEATDMGIDAATFTASGSDPSVSMSIGMTLIRKHMVDAQNLLSQYGASSWPSPDFWQLVKGMHALPSQFAVFMQSYVQANGAPPSGWNDLISYGESTYGSSSNYNLSRTDTIANATWVGSFAPPSADPMFGSSSSASSNIKFGAIAAGVAAATIIAIGIGMSASRG